MTTKESRLARQLMTESGLTYQQALLRVREDFAREQPTEFLGRHMLMSFGGDERPIEPGETRVIIAKPAYEFKADGMLSFGGSRWPTSEGGAGGLIVKSVSTGGLECLDDLVVGYQMVVNRHHRLENQIVCGLMQASQQIAFTIHNPTRYAGVCQGILQGSTPGGAPTTARRVCWVGYDLEPGKTLEYRFMVKKAFQPTRVSIDNTSFTVQQTDDHPVTHGCKGVLLKSSSVIYGEASGVPAESIGISIFDTAWPGKPLVDYRLLEAGQEMVLEFSNPTTATVPEIAVRIDGNVVQTGGVQ